MAKWWRSGRQLVVLRSERLATTGLEHSPCDDGDEISHVVLGVGWGVRFSSGETVVGIMGILL